MARRGPGRLAGGGIMGLAVALVASLVPALQQPVQAAEVTPRAPQWVEPVEVSPVPVRPQRAKKAAEVRGTPTVTWPARGTAEVSLGAARASGAGGSAQQRPVRVGEHPVWVGPAGSRSGSTPDRLRVEVLGRDAATQAGLAGVLLRVRPTGRSAPSGGPDPAAKADGPRGATGAAGRVSLTVSYAGFRHAYGGDWAARLRLVRLPACAATTPAVPACRRSTPVASRNDLATGRVTGEVDLAADGGVYALAAEPAGSTGDFTATSLTPAGSWQVTAQTGAFNWSHPLRVPTVPGDLVPDLAASYSASAVDGRVATTNNQTSWLGEGWDLAAGFIERRYIGCADDTAGGSPRTGDLCWRGEHLVLSLDGSATELVRDDATGTWRLAADDGSRVQRLTGADNGDNNGEHWRLTTTDGTQYYFGLGRLPDGGGVTNSTWTVPVFGNDPNEPCHAATFAESHCTQAYRWNLDHVVDPRGNTIRYYYRTETNRYGRNMGQASATYVRGGTLERIDYGTRLGSTASAPARVLFAVADRCAAGADCTQRTPASWPDVPWDRHCDSADCGDRYAPTFWSTKRLASVTTQVKAASDADYRDVERWTFEHTYPATGDETSPALWLSAIRHTGLAGGSVADPPVTFEGIALPNRVNSAVDGLPRMNKRRIETINTESGGEITVTYAPADCTADALPTPDSNTRRCFPVRWAPVDAEPVDDWFHKYVVATVGLVDRVGGSPSQFTNYHYLGGAAWAYDDDPLVPEKYRSWTSWRGYEQVEIRTGDPADAGNPVQSAVRQHYFRGMDGDRRASGGKKEVSLTDSEGKTHADLPHLRGFLLEEITYAGVNGPEVTGTVHEPWTRGPTATEGNRKAYQVRDGVTRTRTALSAGGYRRTETRTSYDEYGLPTTVDDRGDLADPADDRCVRTSYARNTAAWLLELPSRVETVGVACSATPSYPRDAISDVRTYYDDLAHGAAPTAGNPTRVEELAGYDGTTPTYRVRSRSRYDDYGRVIEAADALDRKTTTSYSPATGLPTTKTDTNPLGHVTTTTLDPAWNEPVAVVDANGRRTEFAYDALGRATAIWTPGRQRQQNPTVRFDYGLRADSASWLSIRRLKPNGNYVTEYTLFDGFLRERQKQQPSPHGGRVLTDTIYDARGLVARRNAAYYNDQAGPGTTLVTPDDNQVPNQTVTVHDGAGRVVAEIYEKLGVEQWRTSYAQGGDHVTVTPPAGGVATTTYTDARGRVTEVREYPGGTPSGTYHRTLRSYTAAGELATLTDALGNVWTETYDVAGRRIRSTDPDRGTVEYGYDAAGQLVRTTDARGKTVVYAYDALGRRTEAREGSATGKLLASWTYDTLAKGQLTSTTRYVGDHAYRTEITGYDAEYRVTGRRTVIPDGEGKLAGSYETTTTYRADGSIDTISLPKLGDLPAETLVYEYDDLGLPTTTTGLADYVTATRYTPLGEFTQLQHGTAGQRVWHTVYYTDGLRRLAESAVQREVAGSLYLDETHYTYDPAGNVRQIDTSTAGAGLDRQCFGYDGLRRLTEAWTTTGACAEPGTAVGGPAPYWSSYRYDEVGRRLSEVRHGVGGAADTTVTMSYPAAGEPRPHAPTSVTVAGPMAATSAAVGSYAYDAAGNTTSRPGPAGAQEYTWDAEGQLASVTVNGVTTSYVNTPDNERLLARDSAGATVYLASGEIHLDSATGKVTGTRYYQHGERVVAARTAAGVSYLVGDHQGTATLAVNAATLSGEKRRFDPFGQPRGAQPENWPGRRGFVGGTGDDASGLTRLGVRDYDPATGTFLTVDPVLDPDIPQQLNAYSYAVNNPTTFSDSTGEFFLWDIIGIALQVAGKVTKNKWLSAAGRIMTVIGVAAKGGYRRLPACNRAGDCQVGRRGPTAAELADREAKARAQRNKELARRERVIERELNKHLGAKVDLDLMKELERVTHGLHGSFSVCVSASAGAIFVGGMEVCLNVDDVGFSFSRAEKLGLEAGVGIEAGPAVRWNSVKADQVAASPSESWELGAEARWFAGGGIKGGLERGDGGEHSFFFQLEAGFGGKASIGGYYQNTGENGGYLCKWNSGCDW